LLFLASLAETQPSSLNLPSSTTVASNSPSPSGHQSVPTVPSSTSTTSGVSQNASGLPPKYNLRPGSVPQVQPNTPPNLSLPPDTHSPLEMHKDSTTIQTDMHAEATNDQMSKDLDKGEARGYWSPQEHEKFLQALSKYGDKGTALAYVDAHCFKISRLLQIMFKQGQIHKYEVTYKNI
jgi:hypothetical protein